MKGSIAGAISLALTLFVAVPSTPAGTTPEFAVKKFTVDGGGGKSIGGVYSITGTIGQPDASVQNSTGATYTLSSGFWSRFISDLLFMDGFEDF